MDTPTLTPAPGTPCACLCTLWRHVGICTGEATRLIQLAGGPRGERGYQACEHCAEAIMQSAREQYAYKT